MNPVSRRQKVTERSRMAGQPRRAKTHANTKVRASQSKIGPRVSYFFIVPMRPYRLF
jgi:hypothetical protein